MPGGGGNCPPEPRAGNYSSLVTFGKEEGTNSLDTTHSISFSLQLATGVLTLVDWSREEEVRGIVSLAFFEEVLGGR